MRIEAVAKAKKIPLQHGAMSSNSGTDTDVIFWTRGGIASALVSLRTVTCTRRWKCEPERLEKIPNCSRPSPSRSRPANSSR